jgi:hypothetical protein
MYSYTGVLRVHTWHLHILGVVWNIGLYVCIDTDHMYSSLLYILRGSVGLNLSNILRNGRKKVHHGLWNGCDDLSIQFLALTKSTYVCMYVCALYVYIERIIIHFCAPLCCRFPACNSSFMSWAKELIAFKRRSQQYRATPPSQLLIAIKPPEEGFIPLRRFRLVRFIHSIDPTSILFAEFGKCQSIYILFVVK